MSLPVKGEFTKITKNKKYMLKCSECLVFNQLLMILTSYHDTPDHIWYLLATGTPCGTHGSCNN